MALPACHLTIPQPAGISLVWPWATVTTRRDSPIGHAAGTALLSDPGDTHADLLGPPTTSVSECRLSGSGRGLPLWPGAYARGRSAGYLAVSCPYPGRPQRSRAVV